MMPPKRRSNDRARPGKDRHSKHNKSKQNVESHAPAAVAAPQKLFEYDLIQDDDNSLNDLLDEETFTAHTTLDELSADSSGGSSSEVSPETSPMYLDESDPHSTTHKSGSTGHSDKNTGQDASESLALLPRSLHDILKGGVATWNANAKEVYDYFHLDLHLVKPNHILHPRSDLFSVNQVLLDSLRGTKDIVKWNDLSRCLSKFVDDTHLTDLEQLTDCLHDSFHAVTIMTAFIQNNTQNTDKPRSIDEQERVLLLQHIQNLRLQVLKEQQYYTENVFRKLIFWVLNVFWRKLDIYSLQMLTIEDVYKTILLPREIPISAKVDISLRIHGRCILVGEVKPHTKGKLSEQMEAYKGHRVCRSKLKVKGSPASATGSGDNAPTTCSKKKMITRRLTDRERKKVSFVLPQLFGEMLCAGACNSGRSVWRFLQPNQSIMYGISVIGLKFRFATLLIQGPEEDQQKPQFSNIFMRGYKKNMFITQDYNIFKKDHLMSIFQILYAMAYEQY